MKKALVIGGSSGIGLSAVISLIKKGYESIAVLGKEEPAINDIPKSFSKQRVAPKTVNTISTLTGIK